MAVGIVAPKKRLSRHALNSKKASHPKPNLAITHPLEKLQVPEVEAVIDRFFPADLVGYLKHSSPNLVDSYMMTRFHERANLRRRLSDTIMELLHCESQILLAAHCAKQRSRSTAKNNSTKGGTQR